MMATAGATEVQQRVLSDVQEGLFGSGGQVYVSVGGSVVLDFAVGEDATGKPVAESTLFCVYCAAKPVVALGIAHLVDAGELSLDDRIGDIVDRVPAPLAQLQVGQLLNHTAGVHDLQSGAFVASAESHREQLVFGTEPPRGWSVGRDVAYSEIAAWYLLEQAIIELTGGSMQSFLRQAILAPLGLADDMFVGGMSEDDYRNHRPRLGTNMWITGRTELPMLIERTLRFRSLTNATLGSTATARSLGRLYESINLMLKGGDGLLPAALVAEFVTPQSGGFDWVMERECQYGFGFMVWLKDHYFGSRCSTSTFGHSGNGGMTAAFSDPDHDLVVAFHFNGRTDAESAVMYRRPAIVDGIYRSVIGP